ncbi:MAG TPA: hypothetical protein VF074_01950 [Pyrinomonadaceae bacterium]
MRQESQKRGIRSDAQKQQRARKGYDPIPPSNEVGGAFGRHEPDRQSDEDLSLSLNEKRAKKERNEKD